jgi:hypothetical protein
MGVKLQQLFNSTQEVLFDYLGNEITVQYKASGLSPEKLVKAEDIQRAASTTGESEKALRALVELVAGVIVSWDVLDEDGQPIPVTEEFLWDCPLDFVMGLIEAVRGTQEPKKTNRGPSRRGSLQGNQST